MTISLAIDIGLTGAVAAVDHNGRAQVRDLPTVPDGERHRLDGRGLLDMVRQLVPAGETCIVVIEDVRPRPMVNGNARGNTIHSQGSLMRSRGIVEGVLDVLRLTPRAIQPQTWKRHYALLGKDKDESLLTARALFPLAAGDLSRKKDHNRAEALLIAHYGLGEFA